MLLLVDLIINCVFSPSLPPSIYLSLFFSWFSPATSSAQYKSLFFLLIWRLTRMEDKKLESVELSKRRASQTD